MLVVIMTTGMLLLVQNYIAKWLQGGQALSGPSNLLILPT